MTRPPIYLSLMRHRFTLIAAIGAALLFVPSAAHACRGDHEENGRTTIRRVIPWSEDGQVVAEVEVDTLVDVKNFHWSAKILRMIKGRYSGSRMIIVHQALTTCDSFPESGQRGFVVGWPEDSPTGELVLKAVPAFWRDELRASGHNR